MTQHHSWDRQALAAAHACLGADKMCCNGGVVCCHACSAIYSRQWRSNRRSDVDVAGAIACVNDKWTESEPDKGHKLADLVQRCVIIPNDPAAPKFTQDCVGKYDYMPDKSWKASGTCTDTFKGGDKRYESWEEGSHLKEYTRTIIPVALANTKAPVAGARTCTRV